MHESFTAIGKLLSVTPLAALTVILGWRGVGRPATALGDSLTVEFREATEALLAVSNAP